MANLASAKIILAAAVAMASAYYILQDRGIEIKFVGG
jgi:hypothetical protein